MGWTRGGQMVPIERPRYQGDRLLPVRFIGSAGFTNPASAKSKAQANIITTNKWQPTPAWFRARICELAIRLATARQVQRAEEILPAGTLTKTTGVKHGSSLSCRWVAASCCVAATSLRKRYRSKKATWCLHRHRT